MKIFILISTTLLFACAKSPDNSTPAAAAPAPAAIKQRVCSDSFFCAQDCSTSTNANCHVSGVSNDPCSFILNQCLAQPLPSKYN